MNPEILKKLVQSTTLMIEQKNRKRLEEDRKVMIAGLSKDIAAILKPLLEKISENSKLNQSQIVEAITGAIKGNSLKVDVPAPVVNVAPSKLPDIKLPQPVVKYIPPAINIPDIRMPSEMDVKGWIGIMGYDRGLLSNPLPVQLRDASGKPVNLFENLTAVAGGGGGGFRHVIVDNLDQINISSSGGLTDAELRASSLDIDQVSGAVWSVIVNEIYGTAAANLINPDGRMKVELPSGSSGLTNTELRAAHLDTQQVSGAIDSVKITGTDAALDFKQVSGSIDSVKVTGFDSSVGATILNGDGTSLDPRDRNWSITETVPISTTQSIETKQVSGTSDSVSVVSTVGLTNTELRAAHLDTQQLSGAIDSVYVTGIANSSFTELQNGDGRLRVSVETGGSGLTDAELRASAVPVQQVSGAGWSVSVKEIFGSAITSLLNGDNRIPVSVETGGSGLTDAELRATAVPVSQVSGSAWSVSVNDIFGSTAANVVNPDGRLKVELPSGASGLTDTELRAAHLDVEQVSGSIWSTFVTGFADSATVFQARQTNPTAKSDGGDVRPSSDDLGRQIIRPIQARDLIRTAYVSVTNGTETTLRAAVAGAYLDCVSIMGSNNSDAAVTVDIRCTTAGNIVHSLRIPANGTAGWVPQVPWPQDATGNNWTIDGPDETGRTITFSALFSEEI